MTDTSKDCNVMNNMIAFGDLPIGALFRFDGTSYVHCKLSGDHFCNITTRSVRDIHHFFDVSPCVFWVDPPARPEPKPLTLGDLEPGTKFRYPGNHNTFIAGGKATEGNERVVWNENQSHWFTHWIENPVTIIPEPELVELGTLKPGLKFRWQGKEYEATDHYRNSKYRMVFPYSNHTIFDSMALPLITLVEPLVDKAQKGNE